MFRDLHGRIVLLLAASCFALGIAASEEAGKVFTLVIDPGHGGHDAGAVGAISKEKDINLSVALAFGRLVESNCPDVKVVYTRKTDVFIPLQKRADIANRNKADLFISIHTNALPKGKIARGAETYTLGMARAEANLEVAKRENSVITYESNYQEIYEGFDPNKVESYIIFELMQDRYMQQSVELARLVQQQYTRHAGRNNKGVHQAGFLVLRKTSMPAILTELGFISTPDEECYLNSAEGVRQMSQSLYNGFVKYRSVHAATSAGARVIPDNPRKPVAERPVAPKAAKTTPDTVRKDIARAPEKAAEPEPGNDDRAANEDLPVFRVQLFTTDRVLAEGDSRLKGLKPVSYYKEKGLYKYTYGETTAYSEARSLQRSIADRFPQTFIVAFKDGQRIDLAQARGQSRR